MFAHEFVRNAYFAGTPIALACGAVGWFLVLRAQVFAADALSHVAFVGAIAAAVVGVDERIGLFALTLLLALALAPLGRRGQVDDVGIGIVFAWILGIGILLVTILATSPSGGNGITTANTLFGSIYGLSAGASWLAAAVAIAVLAGITILFRPLLFSTLDGELAQLRGVRVGLIATAFLGLLALVTAEATQAVGALLLLGLLAAPAGAAHRLTARPVRGILVAAALATLAMWGGLALSYVIPSLPPSSAIIGLAAATYALASLGDRARRWRARQRPRRIRTTTRAAPRSG